MPELKKIEQLRWGIMDEYGWDILQLNGYLSVDYSDTQIDILPPVVEEIVTPFGEIKAIINDGMHRVYLAYQMGHPIHVAYVRGVNQSFPYYAYNIPSGFDGVEIRENLPEGYCKKFHVAKQHKSLFRNFNLMFSNVGDSRPYTSK